MRMKAYAFKRKAMSVCTTFQAGEPELHRVVVWISKRLKRETALTIFLDFYRR